MTDWDEMITIGRVARPHGNRGQVIVNPESDFIEERFRPGQRLFMRHGDAVIGRAITAARVHQGRPIIGLSEVESISAAEELAGLELRIPAAEMKTLPPGVYYRHDLVGCEVRTVDGRPVGPVVRVEGPLEASRLIVERGGREAIVPLVDAICVKVDPADREILIAPPEGLLELNEP